METNQYRVKISLKNRTEAAEPSVFQYHWRTQVTDNEGFFQGIFTKEEAEEICNSINQDITDNYIGEIIPYTND